MLVAAEATWVSMLVGATANSSPGVDVRLPFLALALPAALAAAWCATIARFGWRWWWTTGVIALGVAVGVALSAGLISELTRSGSWWRAATQPWTAAGHPAAVAAGVAWIAAVLAWGRGVWLGISSPSFRQVAWSLGLGGLAFIGIFAGHADHHAVAFLASTRGAGWLFFVFFPLSASAAALVRGRELQETLLARSATPPGLVWVTVLAVPMLGVGLIALVLASIVGPGAPIVGRAVAHAAEAISAALTAAARWLWHLLPGSRSRAGKAPTAVRSKAGLPREGHGVRPIHAAFTVPAVVWEILAAVAVIGVVYYLIRNISPRMKWRSGPTGEDVAEERSSVFSWRHLLSQLRAALPRWTWRRRPAAALPVALSPEHPEEEATMASVRQAYRRFLSTARASGRGRGMSETARELGARLSADLTPDPAAALSELTHLYDDARYGAARADESMSLAAQVRSDTVRAALEEPLVRATPGA